MPSPAENNDISLPYLLAEKFSLNTNRSLFITGKAGTGKTTFLKRLREESAKNMAVVAPTGVAAVNAGGMTIHSFFQLPVRTLIPTPQSYRQLFAEQRMHQRKRNMLYHLEMLVIDEISMVRADVLDAIDAVLRHYKYRQNLPFGGVQVVMIGDLFQLSPVVTRGEEEMLMAKYYDGPYFFQAKVMQQLQPVYIELDHVFRQQNEQFVTLLNEVRNNRLTEEGRARLNERFIPSFKNTDDDFHITLTTHNNTADSLNNRELEKLKGKEYTFRATIKNDFPQNVFPTDETLVLKEGARVMFIKNDDQKPRRFYNGKQGIVKEMDEEGILVSCDDEEFLVEPMTWENIRYKEDPLTGNIEEEVLGTFTQYPLRLAWAITIHKSQGLTFDKVIIDAQHAFAAGQVYVALSRCRTLEGIVLSTPLLNISLANDLSVLQYTAGQPSITTIEQQLPQAENEYTMQLFGGLFEFHSIVRLIEQLQAHVRKCVSFNPESAPFLQDIKQQCEHLASVGDKFQPQLARLIAGTQVPLLTPNNANTQTDHLQQRLSDANGYFSPLLQSLIEQVRQSPCRSKNKQDASDFQTMIADLYLVLQQKKCLMAAVAEKATVECYMQQKSRFIAKPMLVETFDKPVAKSKQKSKKEPARPKEKKTKEDTFMLTLEMHRSGFRPEGIAAMRHLTLGTIYTHLLKWVEKGEIDPQDIVPTPIINLVREIQDAHPEYTNVGQIRDALGGQVDYGLLRIALLCLEK